jgi:DNA primase
MSYVDFREVKALADIVTVANWLGLELKQNRCQCSVNEGEKRELVLTPEKNLFYCFGCKEGGDQIKLVSHICQIDQKQAAQHIMSRFHGYTPAKKGLPADGLDYLDHAHASVQALGLSPEKAAELGIGWAPRGTMRNHLLIPLRDKTGRLLGYLGYGESGLKLPKNLVE